MSIINTYTWKDRKANVNGYPPPNKIKFEGKFITNVTLKEKLRLFVMKNTNNLFGTNWVVQFKLWNSPISSFYHEIIGFTHKAKSLKKELKIKFSEVFSGGLGRCNKIQAKGKCTTAVQKKKKKSTLCIEKLGILSKVTIAIGYFWECQAHVDSGRAPGLT